MLIPLSALKNNLILVFTMQSKKLHVTGEMIELNTMSRGLIGNVCELCYVCNFIIREKFNFAQKM
jgi:PP-loop superfamily ATP-utilizing enzyme